MNLVDSFLEGSGFIYQKKRVAKRQGSFKEAKKGRTALDGTSLISWAFAKSIGDECMGKRVDAFLNLYPT
jgi:hypothetical protein